MKNNTFIRVLFLLILILSSAIVFAQNKKIDPNRMLDWTLKEKFKIPIEKILSKEQVAKYVKGHVLKSEKKSITDYTVSGGPEIEAELHAAINPTDSNNMVVSPIQQDASIGSISCPVYFTKKFWNNMAQKYVD